MSLVGIARERATGTAQRRQQCPGGPGGFDLRWPAAEAGTWSWGSLHMSVVALSKCVGSLFILSSNSGRIAGIFSVSSVQDKCFQARRSLLEVSTQDLPVFLPILFLWGDAQGLLDTELHEGQLRVGVKFFIRSTCQTCDRQTSLRLFQLLTHNSNT